MKRFVFLLFFVWTSIVANAQSLSVVSPDEIISTDQDREIFEEKKSLFVGESTMPMGELVAAIGKSFQGTPYVAQTLEKSADEKMVINLRELDCTTFAENCLALAITFKSADPSYEAFVSNLQFVRYRNGVRDNYPSRLHYFSEWLTNNASKKLLALPEIEGQENFSKTINFMSMHADSYPILKMRPEFVGQLADIEKTLNERSIKYIPKEKVEAIESQISDGDIAGLTTTIDGLDMSHTVLLIRVDGRVHLLHASLTAKKVLISEQPLSDYLLEGKKLTGIMLGRPLDK